MNQSVCLVLVLLVVSFAVDTRGQHGGKRIRAVERPYVGIITVSNGQIWGTWGKREMCPLGTYATGFSLKVEPQQRPAHDDTALNGIALRCSTPRDPSSSIVSFATVKSSTGSWGEWTENSWCTRGVMRSFQLRVEPRQGWGDDTAANNIRFSCTGGQVMEGHGMSWGSWGAWSGTCLGRGICGIETKVEVPQGAGDDTALNDVRFYCCS